MDRDATERIDLRDYLAILKARKWTIVLATALAILASLALSSRQTPIYEAEARIIVEPNAQTGYFPEAENEAEVVRSAQVAALVKEDLETTASVDELIGSVRAQQTTPTSDIIAITYTSTDPEFARDAANSFARNYLEFRRSDLVESVQTVRQEILGRIADVEARLQQLSAQIEAAEESGNDARASSLDAERGSLIARLGVLQQRLDDTQSAGGAESISVGRLNNPASAPGSPSSPNHTRNAILGGFIGILIGIGLAFLRERFDDRFRGRPDVERTMGSAVLATVPHFAKTGRDTDLPVITDPKGPASEAYRNLRTGVQFLAAQRGIRSLLVTSPSAHEGKTSTTANLGVALSQTGRRVVLVSADLRRPQLESAFGVSAEHGLSAWLLGEEDDLSKILLEHPEIPNLRLLPVGAIPSNPAELLTSPRLGELIEELKKTHDLVIFDSPPVLPVADAVILASHLDAVVLIFDAASTGRTAAMHAKEQIERVGGTVIGCVLNAFDAAGTPYYYEPYSYSSYYGPDTDSDQTPRRRRDDQPGIIDIRRNTR